VSALLIETGPGGYLITLPHDALNKLNYVRERGQSYSDVIFCCADEHVFRTNQAS
jgi:hypothetical protein